MKIKLVGPQEIGLDYPINDEIEKGWREALARAGAAANGRKYRGTIKPGRGRGPGAGPTITGRVQKGQRRYLHGTGRLERRGIAVGRYYVAGIGHKRNFVRAGDWRALGLAGKMNGQEQVEREAKFQSLPEDLHQQYYHSPLVHARVDAWLHGKVDRESMLATHQRFQARIILQYFRSLSLYFYEHNRDHYTCLEIVFAVKKNQKSTIKNLPPYSRCRAL